MGYLKIGHGVEGCGGGGNVLGTLEGLGGGCEDEYDGDSLFVCMNSSKNESLHEIGKNILKNNMNF